MTSQPIMWSMVCDDVRPEVGGKLSYMGVYSGSLIVNEFPATLPKLCFVLNLRVDVKSPIRRLAFRIMRDETQLILLESTPEQMAALAAQAEAQSKTPEQSGEHLHVTITAVCAVVPFEVDAACKLRIRADTDQGEIRGGVVSAIKGEVQRT